MRKYMTYAETESLLITTINLSGSSIKDIAAATDIKANTLYKWKTTPVHLSPEKADKLLLYFVEREPDKLELAEVVRPARGRWCMWMRITICLPLKAENSSIFV